MVVRTDSYGLPMPTKDSPMPEGQPNVPILIKKGEVANDQLYATIRLYEQGVVTADAAIEMLKTHKLFNQLSFHTVKVIPLLKFTESIEV